MAGVIDRIVASAKAILTSVRIVISFEMVRSQPQANPRVPGVTPPSLKSNAIVARHGLAASSGMSPKKAVRWMMRDEARDKLRISEAATRYAVEAGAAVERPGEKLH